MDTDLSGKTALITGGGTGIGAACAVAQASGGCHVAINGRRDAELSQILKARYCVLLRFPRVSR